MDIPFNAPSFSLTGVYPCRIVSIHDGDTFTGVIPFGQSYYKFSIRIAGIDTAEITSKNTFLKMKAVMARDKLFGLFTNTNIDTTLWKKSDYENYFMNHVSIHRIQCEGMDKYGRVLAKVYNFGDILINLNLAYKYEGKTKLNEEDQLITFHSQSAGNRVPLHTCHSVEEQ